MDRGGSAPRVGDESLAAISLHGEVMNGGLLHALEVRAKADVVDGVAAFSYFSLESAAAAVEWAAGEVTKSGSATSLDDAERLEREANERYWLAVPDDATLVGAFEEMFGRRPKAFSPFDTQAGADRGQ